jgi:hypothetical protein
MTGFTASGRAQFDAANAGSQRQKLATQPYPPTSVVQFKQLKNRNICSAAIPFVTRMPLATTQPNPIPISP